MLDSPTPQESPRGGGSPRWLSVGGLIGIAAVSLLVVFTDGKQLVLVLRRVDGPSLVLPVACTVASYAAMARSYQRIASAAGLELGFPEMLRITLVSTAANYILSTGGLSGLAVRSYYFSQQHRLSSGNAVSISLAQTFITNLVLFVFLFWGVLSLYVYGGVGGFSIVGVALLFFVSFTLCLGAVAVVASRRARLKLFAALLWSAGALSRAFHRQPDAIRLRLARFEEELHDGLDFLIARGRKMISPFLYICADWFLMLATLYTAFQCIGQDVPMHLVVIGFSAGVFLSLVNLVPGGLGIMEGSMAAVFAGLGVPLEAAVVAALIFRASYYLLPLLVTLLFFRGTIGGAALAASRNARSLEQPTR